MGVTVYGVSDDLIEVDGDISEEFNALDIDIDNDDGGLLAFSNGVVLRIAYSPDGIWRITPLANDENVTIDFAPTDDDDNYSDRAVIDDEVSWVVCGAAWAKR